MPKPNANTQKPQPAVTVRIEPGKVSRAQLEQWRKLWVRLISEARLIAKAQDEAGK
jgi:hypothetical protein